MQVPNLHILGKSTEKGNSLIWYRLKTILGHINLKYEVLQLFLELRSLKFDIGFYFDKINVMAILTAKNITLPKSAFKEKEGVVVLPLKKWRIIETALEDLEMYRSRSLAGEIGKARKEKATVSLNSLLKKHSI